MLAFSNVYLMKKIYIICDKWKRVYKLIKTNLKKKLFNVSINFLILIFQEQITEENQINESYK